MAGKRRHAFSSDEEVEAAGADCEEVASGMSAMTGPEESMALNGAREFAARLWMLRGHSKPSPKNSRQGDEDVSPRGSWNRRLSNVAMNDGSSPHGSWSSAKSFRQGDGDGDGLPRSGGSWNCRMPPGTDSPLTARSRAADESSSLSPMRSCGSTCGPLTPASMDRRRRRSSSSMANELFSNPAVRAGLRSSWLMSSPIEDLALAHRQGQEAASRPDGDDEAADDIHDDDGRGGESGGVYQDEDGGAAQSGHRHAN